MTGEANGVSVAERAVAGAKAVPAIPLVVEHVAKSYDVDGRVVPVIGDLSLTLESGQIVSISSPTRTAPGTDFWGGMAVTNAEHVISSRLRLAVAGLARNATIP